MPPAADTPPIRAAALSPPPPPAPAAPANHDPTLHLPRILCLHGGGTNARIFRAQCRALSARLAPSFRLVFADGPFASPPGPGVSPVYADCGPFRSWLRGGIGSAPETHAGASIDASLATAMRADDAAGATGRWVALLGFSQGAKVAASLLLRQQNGAGGGGGEGLDANFRFAVLMAGRPPLVAIEPDAGARAAAAAAREGLGLLRLPTVHVHGLRDEGLALHRELLDQCCERGSARLVEWDGDHRLPIKTKDVAAVVAEILDVAMETGVLEC